jgi:hypothetical protein
MKWIFALIFVFSFNSIAVESIPATQKYDTDNAVFSVCQSAQTGIIANMHSISECDTAIKARMTSFVITNWGGLVRNSPTGYSRPYSAYVKSTGQPANSTVFYTFSTAPILTYVCDNTSYPIGPVDLNGSKVCQKPPKFCMMGAIIRVASDGIETCVSNCSAASGLIKTSQFYYQAGPDVGSTAGQVQCYGQCAVQTSGSFAQLSNGAYTGTFAFTGANCPVVRPEPTVDSESNTGGNGDAPAVDESTTSEGTDNAIDELAGAASSATSTQVEPSVTGPDGTATIKDVAQTIADAANAQIKATSAQNVAFGNLISNISSDIQNATIKSGVGGGGASSSLQAQGNSKLGEISDKLGEISDKLDNETEELTFTPPNAANPFWENVLPQSSFDSISAQKDSAIDEFKELQQNFRQSLFTSDITASGEKPTFDLSFNSASFNAGSFIFDTISTAGIYSIIILIAMMTALYIIMNRSK